jgi:K+-sensing histidine kinase KdpD
LPRFAAPSLPPSSLSAAYSFRIKDPQEVIDLVLFIFVAVTVSQLATRLKRHWK